MITIKSTSGTIRIVHSRPRGRPRIMTAEQAESAFRRYVIGGERLSVIAKDLGAKAETVRATIKRLKVARSLAGPAQTKAKSLTEEKAA